MTVRELMDLFVQNDKDHSGQLEAHEIAAILNEVHCMTDENQVKKMMNDMDKDGDAAMDFEEFLTLCQVMYAERGGYVVANKSGQVTFNQTRVLLTDIGDRVERNHLQLEHLKTQIANLDEQIEIMDTIQQHSALQAELNATKEEKARLVKLHQQMEVQHKGWMRDLKGIHAREKRDVNAKIKFITDQTAKSQVTLDFVTKEYKDDLDVAMKEVKEAKTAIEEVLEFCEKSVDNATKDTNNVNEMTRLAKERLSRYQEGDSARGVYSPKVYDSGSAILAFLKNKTSAMEKWLISRTQFTQQDKKRYLDRVAAVKDQRTEFEENIKALSGQMDIVHKKTKELTKKFEAESEINKKVKAQLHQPDKREHDEKLAKELEARLQVIQKGIADGMQEKFALMQPLYAKEHELGLQRSSIRMLQVELGELKILMNNVHHHERVEKRFAKNATDAAKRVNKRGGDGELARLGAMYA